MSVAPAVSATDVWDHLPDEELPDYLKPFDPDEEEMAKPETCEREYGGQEDQDDVHVGIDAVGHNILTHFPFDKNCPVCQNCKMQKSSHRRSQNRAWDHDGTSSPTVFGQHLTADHAIMGHGEDGRQGQKMSLIIQDRFPDGWNLTRRPLNHRTKFPVYLGGSSVR